MKISSYSYIVRAFLLSTKVPAPFWGEAALHTPHAINRISRSEERRVGKECQ